MLKELGEGEEGRRRGGEGVVEGGGAVRMKASHTCICSKKSRV